MRIYLDNSATTKPYPEVVAAMQQVLQENWGNPSGIHSFGRDAYDAMSAARRQVAALLGAEPDEIYFTSGGTEADNLAILGVAGRFQRGHIITSSIEHAAVLNCCRYLEGQGFEVTYLPPDEDGLISPAQVEQALRPDTLLVSLMLANNEIGSLQPVAELGRLLSGRGVLLHTDAVQAVGKAPVQVAELGVDMLTLSAHKINGPKGCGALYVRHQTDLQPLLWGGGQERSLRSGTENLPGIVGLGVAAELTAQRWPQQARRAAAARDCFWHELSRQLPGVVVNGGWERRLPGNLNLSFEGLESAALLLFLDMAGVAVSAASACSSGRAEPSHVLQALGLPEWRLKSAVRLSFGWENTLMEARQAAAIVAEQVRLLRQDTAAEQLDESFSQPGD